MSAVAHDHPLPGAVARHLSAEEYQADLRARGIRDLRQALRRRRAFVERYPLLVAWLAAPLPERVGHVLGEPLERMTCRVAYDARSYLYFLVRRGCLRLDYAWLLAIQRTKVCGVLAGTPLTAGLDRLRDEAIGLGYDATRVDDPLRWAVGRLFLHTGKGDVEALTLADIEELRAAIVAFGARADLTAYYQSATTWDFVRREALGSLHVLWVVLYHRGQVTEEPRWHRRPAAPPPPPSPPLLTATVARYLAQRRAAGCRPRTVTRLDQALRRFIAWLVAERPCVMSFAEVTREDVLAYAQWLDTAVAPQTGRPLAPQTKHHLLSSLAVFFRQTAHWGWAESPDRPLLLAGDLPRLPLRVPRYIPEDQLAQLMAAIRALPCPYRRAALLVARWSGARRDEIRRLPVDCLDHYPDGTPRLHLPVGKSRAERVVPLTEEAAEAIRALQRLRQVGDRGLRDDYTGEVTRYLFVHHGQHYSASYLFESALAEACRAAGLVDAAGKPTMTAHRFRHTVGTQLAERGASLYTIMKVLGHTSASMAMVYSHISDREVLRDYHAVLRPGALIAGPLAETIRTGAVPAATIDWLKANFFKTELELGHCLRLPQEGPCECDLYLTCAKFVTTLAYAPRLQQRRHLELQLAADAATRGWPREVERHRCVAARLERVLADLGVPLEATAEEQAASALGTSPIVRGP